MLHQSLGRWTHFARCWAKFIKLWLDDWKKGATNAPSNIAAQKQQYRRVTDHIVHVDKRSFARQNIPMQLVLVARSVAFSLQSNRSRDRMESSWDHLFSAIWAPWFCSTSEYDCRVHTGRKMNWAKEVTPPSFRHNFSHQSRYKNNRRLQQEDTQNIPCFWSVKLADTPGIGRKMQAAWAIFFISDHCGNPIHLSHHPHRIYKK